MNWLLLLICCIVSRLFTSIYYIEDPDSLRFALAALDYDVARMQPHFPAYPVFCGLVKLFLLALPRYALAFSVVGGLATFTIIYSGIQILKHFKSTSFWQWTFTLLIFFNPLIWLLGNRYMPDLMGAAVVMFAIYIWLYYDKISNSIPIAIGIILGFLIGLLIGVRLSYLPMVFLPALYVFFTRKDKLHQLLGGLLGVLVWLIPLVLDTGWAALIHIAQQQTDGHFNDFGGTIQTEGNLNFRFIKMFLHGWADGLGGYWQGRHWSTVFISLGLLFFSGLGFWKVLRNGGRWTVDGGRKSKLQQLKILFLSPIVYAYWIFFYQNIVFKSRHHLPLIVFAILLITVGCYMVCQYSKPIFYACFGVFLIANIYLTINLVQQHQQPVAISQLKDYLTKNTDDKTVILVSELVQYYLTKQGVKANFMDINDPNLDIKKLPYQKVWLIANFKTYKGYNLKPIQVFHHNPYVNRMWASVILSEME